MYSLVVTGMSFIAISLIAIGLAMELNPAFVKNVHRAWFKPGLVINMVLFVIGAIAMAVLGTQEALATGEAAAPQMDLLHAGASVGLGFEIIAVSLPTIISIIAAGVAVSKIGTAGLAVVAEKPEVFGRTLIYLGLAEGLAIYGLVLSILLMGKM
jgi:V/A-type H+-transporting ATPase subunit K